MSSSTEKKYTDELYVDADSSNESSPLISTASSSSSTISRSSSKVCCTIGSTSYCNKSCTIPASPWPVYIVAILFFIPEAINNTALSSILYNKLCFQHYADLELCSNRTFTETHPDLQVEQARWSNYVSLLQLPFSIFTNLLLSSYCDKVGHKLPMTLPVAGLVLATIYLAILSSSQFVNLPMSAVLVYPFLNRILGGYPLVIVAAFSYIGLVTPLENRAFHMAIAEGTLGIGMLIGNLINGPIIDAFGLNTMTYITAAISLLPLFVALIFVRDVVSHGHTTSSWRAVFDFSGILDAFKTIYRKRNGYHRLLLNLSFVLYCCPFIATVCLSSTSFLYLVKEGGFTMTEYSVFLGYDSFLLSCGAPLVIAIVKRCINPNEFTFAISCSASMVIGYIIFSFSFIPNSMWIGVVFLTTQGCLFAIVRTIQTKICGKGEFGKLFAFDAIIQCVLSTAISVGAKEVYTASLSFWPGLFSAINAVIIFVSMLVTAVMSSYNHKHNMMTVNLSQES